MYQSKDVSCAQASTRFGDVVAPCRTEAIQTHPSVLYETVKLTLKISIKKIMNCKVFNTTPILSALKIKFGKPPVDRDLRFDTVLKAASQSVYQ